MQPPEPTVPETSLELPPTAAGEPQPETALELPPAPALPMPVEQPGPAPAPGPLGNLVVAHFRRVEIAMLGRVLISTLAGALPASMVRVERRRSLAKRLTGRAAEPIGVTVTAGERSLTFRAPELGLAEASIGHTVRGVVLSSTPVPVAQWLDELEDVLNQATRDDEATRLALERALG